MPDYKALMEQVGRIGETERAYGDALSTCIGIALMVIRTHRRVSQERLASLLGDRAVIPVTQGYVSKVEKGHTRVSWSRLALFCTCLNCKPSQVIALAEFLADRNLRPDREIIAAWMRDREAVE